MKELIKVITILLILAGTNACDPGMIIRQDLKNTNFNTYDSLNEGIVILNVKEQSKLIGEALYVPEIKVINNYSSSISINSFELMTRKKKLYTATWTSKKILHTAKWGKENFPQTLKAGDAITLRPFFDLDESVYEVFKEPAELRLNYEISGNELVTSVQVESTWR